MLIVMGPIIQGGAEWQLYELIRRLDRSVFRPVLATVEFNTYRELVIGEGDRAIREAYDSLDVPRYDITGRGRWSLGNARELMRVIVGERIELVHTNLFAGETWGRVAALLSRRPIVTHKRGIPFKSRKPYNVLFDWLLNLATARIIVVNDVVGRELTRLEPLIGSKVRVIHPGIEPELWRRPRLKETAMLRDSLGLVGKRVVVCVARLRPIKGHKYLLASMPRVLEVCPESVLLLVGHGVDEPALRAQATDLGISDHVRFLGNRTDVRELLSLADVSVLASLSEASPVALMESAFLGVPAVVTSVGGVAGVVCDGVTGVLVPPRNPTALADAMVGLLQDAQRRARMSEAAMRWAAEQFDIERTVRSVEEAYLEALEGLC